MLHLELEFWILISKWTGVGKNYEAKSEKLFKNTVRTSLVIKSNKSPKTLHASSKYQEITKLFQTLYATICMKMKVFLVGRKKKWSSKNKVRLFINTQLTKVVECIVGVYSHLQGFMPKIGKPESIYANKTGRLTNHQLTDEVHWITSLRRKKFHYDLQKLIRS